MVSYQIVVLDCVLTRFDRFSIVAIFLLDNSYSSIADCFVSAMGHKMRMMLIFVQML